MIEHNTSSPLDPLGKMDASKRRFSKVLKIISSTTGFLGVSDKCVTSFSMKEGPSLGMRGGQNQCKLCPKCCPPSSTDIL